LSFDFLPPGKKYRASFYSDDDNVQTKTKVKVERKIITSSKSIDVSLKPSGGQAIWITPVQ
jgi:alpha-glucosidase